MPRTVFQLRYFLSLYLLLVCVLSFAQDREFVSATVIDKKTGEPVVFATVYIKGTSKGVITNMDGGFRLPKHYKDEGNIILISSMGYQKKEVALFELSPFSVNTIRLTQSIVELTEAVVTAKKKREPTARQILRRAVARIPQNFPFTSFTTKGYYRDYQMDSLGYLNLNEALLEVLDKGFGEIDSANTRVRLYDYIQNEEFRRDTLADDPYNYRNWYKIIDNAYLPNHGGNELTILRIHDAIRNYRISTFDFIHTVEKGDILKNHSLKKLPETNMDDERLYAIKIRKVLEDYIAKGVIYIAKSDYGIHKLRYAVYDKRRSNTTENLSGFEMNEKLLFEVITEYKRGLYDKLYPNYISFHNTFKLAEPPKFAVKYLTVLPNRSAFELRFNNALAFVDPRFRRIGDPKPNSKKWYDFKYKGKKIRFNEIVVINDSTVHLYPKMDSKPLMQMMGDLVMMKRKKINVATVFKFKVSGLQDLDGNALNDWGYKDYNQFREFFVQEVENAYQMPADNLLMNKRKPIFEDQPIVKPYNFNDYWMNTPLKSIKN